MAKGKGRPGGNPEIVNYAFPQQHDWGESCTVGKTLKLPPSMAAALKRGVLPDWQEVCRRAIAVELGWQVNERAEVNGG